MKGTLRPSVCLAAGLLAIATLPVRADTLVVLGLRNDLPEGKKYEKWQDFRLGMGIRGRLTQMAADAGGFTLLEDRTLAASVGEALGGYWLRETPALEDPESVLRATGAAWVLYGNLDHVGVTRDRVSGPLSVARWRYRVHLTVCLYSDGLGEICQEGEGRSKTTKVAVGFEYRGNDLAWDQAGPAEAVTQALGEAFAALARRASPHLGRPDETRIAGHVLEDGQPLPVYVAGFGLSSTVARTYPELPASQVGWGLSQRIVESLYDSGRFTFVEEKAEVVEHVARLLRGEVPAGGGEAGEAEWLLYGEVVDLQVARREKITKGAAEIETRITLQTRLVERESQRFYPATATGSHVARLVGWKAGRPIDELDERSVGMATDAAVREAVEKLVRSLSEDS